MTANKTAPTNSDIAALTKAVRECNKGITALNKKVDDIKRQQDERHKALSKRLDNTQNTNDRAHNRIEKQCEVIAKTQNRMDKLSTETLAAIKAATEATTAAATAATNAAEALTAAAVHDVKLEQHEQIIQAQGATQQGIKDKAWYGLWTLLAGAATIICALVWDKLQK